MIKYRSTIPLPKLPKGVTTPTRLPQTYVVRCRRFVKIGQSNNLEVRMRTILSHMPFDIEVLAIFEDPNTEKVLQRLFRKQRLRDEWFFERGLLERWILSGCPSQFMANRKPVNLGLGWAAPILVLLKAA